MKKALSPFLKSYGFSLFLISSLILGALLGLIFEKDATIFKPLGDVFLNLLFTAIVPLVFFSISSTVASMTDLKRLGKILSVMLGIFVATGLFASIIMMTAVQLCPPAEGVRVPLSPSTHSRSVQVVDQIVRAFTAPDFALLLSKDNMLALIVFSILTGLSVSAMGPRGKAFGRFLASGNAVMMKLISFIMYYAPVGLCAYFAYLVGVFGPQLLGAYARAVALYYPTALAYYVFAFSFYAALAGGGTGVRKFWGNIMPPSLTALATGSSMAAIPSNMQAAENIGVPKDIREVVIPVGATMHMEGSCLAAVLKIAFLFGIYRMPLAGFETLLAALGIALLTGVVVSGIPGGGTIGELLILSFYGFPPEAFALITMIGTLVDAPATMLNAVGDNVSSMMTARVLDGKRWMEKAIENNSSQITRSGS
jgi:Na+/H+-dicarboxylate symporter